MINYPTDEWIQRCQEKAKTDDVVYNKKRVHQGQGFWVRHYILEQVGQQTRVPGKEI